MTSDEQHQLRIVYLEKVILSDVVTNELFLLWVGNFIGNHKEITPGNIKMSNSNQFKQDLTRCVY